MGVIQVVAFYAKTLQKVHSYPHASGTKIQKIIIKLHAL
jgi:hypothetical protein